MILDENGIPGHTPPLTEKAYRILHMMEDIHKHHHIEARILVGKDIAIEALNGNITLLTQRNIDAPDINVGAFLLDAGVQEAVATPHIQDARLAWNPFADALTQDACAPAVNISSMEMVRQTHVILKNSSYQ
jgi:hypothetical protein